MTRKKCWLNCVLGAIVLAIGCSPSTPTVTGTVTYNGGPVENGYISFRPVDGRGQSFATNITDGKYAAVDRVTPGMKRVIITGFNEVSLVTREEASRRAAQGINEPIDYIAEDAEGNSKEVEILPGDQTLDFSITGAPIPQ